MTETKKVLSVAIVGLGHLHPRSYMPLFEAEAATQVVAVVEADAALRRDGVVDAQMEAVCQQSRRTVESHLKDFEAKMIAANRDVKHIATTVSYIRTICQESGFAVVADIEADGVNLYASRLKQLGRSARTVQAHLVAIKGFTRWLTEHRKLTHDPLALVQRPNAKADQRRERRMLLHDEWDWLRMTTLAGVERYGMPPVERVLLYVVAIQTGLRSSELRSLTRGRLFLDSKPPYITCKAGWTKNHKDARQYIQPALADELRLHIATKVPKSWVFSMPAREDVAAMLRADLADARQAWLKAAKHDPEEYLRRQRSDFLTAENHEGEILDFHSLRHTCGAWLAMTGAHPKVVQTIMRHSTITLTMDTYGHLFPGQEAEAIARFPDMLGEGPIQLRATGTDGA